MTAREKLFTIADLRQLEALPENAATRFELLYGELIEMPRPGWLHSVIMTRLTYLLMEYANAHGLGQVLADSVAYTLADDVELAPDVSFIAAARVPADFDALPAFAPDLAVEVMSPSNRSRHLFTKAETYLRFGARLVWIVYPDEKMVDVCRPAPDGGLYIHNVSGAGMLEGGEVLPGFSLPLTQIFPAAKTEESA